VGGIGWALFERHERGGLVKKSERSCQGLDDPSATTTLPLGLPLTPGETVLRVTTQGKTTIAFAKIPGGRDDIVAVRDRVLTDLRAAGYIVKGTDQEPGYEAEAELAGTHEGTLKVSPLCTGLLEIRYKIQQ
jgi:hypothetical protein